MLSDPVRPWTTSEYEAARDYMKQFSARRIRYVECAVAGRVLWGVGIDPSITTSSLKAIISAVNRAVR